MSWPLASHFSAMLQNPGVAFRDPELKLCRVEKDERNQPRPWSGSFAVVYRGIDAAGEGSFAIRCFTTESPERRERYNLLSAYLKTRRLNCLVDFEYRDRAIRSAGDGKWYPLILMDWVEGETLFKWARARSLEGNHRMLALAADRWVDLVRELGDASIAHGDLQHANIMVTNAGQLKLVDYDGMCVPTLVGRRNLEIGVVPYQHPSRNARTLLSLDLDNFSALLIYVALRALAADPQLWTKYIEASGHDKLLFRADDFRMPHASALYRDLAHSADQEVRDLTGSLFELARVPMYQVPPLSHLASSYVKAEQLLNAGEWEAAVELLNRRGQFRDAPEHLKPLIDQAYEYICRQQAWVKFQKLPHKPSEQCDRDVVDGWNEALFAGFAPAETQRARMTAARQRVACVERLRHLAQQAGNTVSLSGERSMAEAASHLAENYDYSLKFRVQQATWRVDVIDRLLEAVDRDTDETAIVKAWKQVVKAGCEKLVGQPMRQRVKLAERRYPLVQALGEVPSDFTADQLDQRLIDIWKDELLEDCAQADPWREQYRVAVERRELLGRLEAAVNGNDEAAMAQLAEEPCLADYPLPEGWADQLRRARDQAERSEQLLEALAAGDRTSFTRLFDARAIRRDAERFSRHESLLEKWIRSELAPIEKLGLCPAVGRASLISVDRSEGTYRVRWTWPAQRFSDECVLAVCRHEPAEGDEPGEMPDHFNIKIDRPTWEREGGSQLLRAEPDWAGGYVTVWAVIDPGFRSFFSEPLLLGRIEKSSKRLGLKGLRKLLPHRKKEPADSSTPQPEQGDQT